MSNLLPLNRDNPVPDRFSTGSRSSMRQRIIGVFLFLAGMRRGNPAVQSGSLSLPGIDICIKTGRGMYNIFNSIIWTIHTDREKTLKVL